MPSNSGTNPSTPGAAALRQTRTSAAARDPQAGGAAAVPPPNVAAAAPAAAPQDNTVAQLQAQVQQLLRVVAGLQHQQQAPPAPAAPAAAPRFAATPAAYTTGILDFNKKSDTILFKEATKSLYQDPTERYNLGPEHTQAFLNRIYDRGLHCNISVLLIPADNAAPNGDKINYCRNHARFNLEHLQTFVRSYIHLQDRRVQDDKILYRLLQESLTEAAYKIISTDRSHYTVDNVESGLLMLKHILERSSVDTNIDPDIIRDELTRAADKFVALHYDVKKFNEWFVEKVEQLKQNDVPDVALSWLRALLFAAYDRSNDAKFRNYIEDQKDHLRDNPTLSKTFTWKDLMSRASKKVDSLLLDSKRDNSTESQDPILALQAQMASQQKTIKKLYKQFQSEPSSKSKDNGKGKDKKGSQQNKKSRYPKELEKKGRPSDPTKPLTIKGVDYYWCDGHKAWGKHTTAACNKRKSEKASESQDKTSKPSDGDRKGRLVKAFAALVDN